MRTPAGVIALLGMGMCACHPAADTAPRAAADPVAGETASGGGCGNPGTFRAKLYGEISADLSWPSAQYECRGMPHPGGAGARLFFAGPVAHGSGRLAFILTIPEFDRDSAGDQLASTMTVIEEGSGRFYSTASGANCLADIATVDISDLQPQHLAVSGDVYCVSPLAEVNGPSSISIAELSFAGMVDLSGP